MIKVVVGLSVAFVGVLGIAVYFWIGFDIAKLTIDAEMTQTPVIVVRVDAVDSANHSNELDRLYLKPRSRIYLNEGGSNIHESEVEYVAAGPADYESAKVSISVLPAGQIYLDLITEPDTLLLEQAVTSDQTFFNEYVAPLSQPIESSQNVLLALAAIEPEADSALNSMVSDSIEAFGAQVVLAKNVHTMRGHEKYPFNHVMLVSFPNSYLRGEWLLSHNRKTLFALQHEWLHDYALLVLTDNSA